MRRRLSHASQAPSAPGRRFVRRLAGVVCALAVAIASAGGIPADQDPLPRDESRYPRLKIIGFTDFNFHADDLDGDDEPESGFHEGQFVLHFVSELTEQFNFFGEVSVTPRDSEFKTEVERAIIKYDWNDHIGIGGGRFHTPVTWWNTAFHHGSWLQTTAERPEMTRFGAEFVPVHFVGALAQGEIPSGGMHLGYMAGFGNGRAEDDVRAGDAGDVNNDRAWIVRVRSVPAGLYGLEVGGSFYRDKITPALGEEIREEITSVHVVWSRETPEVIAEYVHVDREGIDTGASYPSDAWYVQVAWRLPVLDARLKPYGRWERIDVDEDDPIFTTTMDLKKYLFGVRADVSSYVALKLEYRRRQDSETSFHEGFFQAAITF